MLIIAFGGRVAHQPGVVSAPASVVMVGVVDGDIADGESHTPKGERNGSENFG
jgi:hypothetical protein